MRQGLGCENYFWPLHSKSFAFLEECAPNMCSVIYINVLL
jgi:hypothetical protein